MRKVFYRKPIRDKIPDKIQNKGSRLETRVLDVAEFQQELRKKLVEEAGGAAKAQTKEELLSELADLYVVIDEILRTNQIYASEMASAKRKNISAKGGFKKRLFLLWSSKDDYKTNEKVGKK